jgi:hypothetical protein
MAAASASAPHTEDIVLASSIAQTSIFMMGEFYNCDSEIAKHTGTVVAAK